MGKLSKIIDIFKQPYDPYKDINTTVVSTTASNMRNKYRGMNERSIINAVLTRIAVDVSMVDFRHARINDKGRYKEDIDGGLNTCLRISPNIDQTSQHLFMDATLTLLEEGCVALIPTKYETDKVTKDIIDIYELRSGRVVQFMPQHVKVEVYNSEIGRTEQIILSKDIVCIVENPFYSIMNTENSIFNRLSHKLAILDAVDDQIGSNKLDLLIQLPYQIKSDDKRRLVQNRLNDIEQQLASSKLGIGYIDQAEKVIQLNRPVENNILKQIEYLTSLLYSQLGITQEILNGTASEYVMNNYRTRIINVIAQRYVDEMNRKWVIDAVDDNRRVLTFKRPFEFATFTDIISAADTLTRNEICSTNEIRSFAGLEESDEPQADELRNKNLNPESNRMAPEAGSGKTLFDGKEETANEEEELSKKYFGL